MLIRGKIRIDPFLLQPTQKVVGVICAVIWSGNVTKHDGDLTAFSTTVGKIKGAGSDERSH